MNSPARKPGVRITETDIENVKSEMLDLLDADLFSWSELSRRTGMSRATLRELAAKVGLIERANFATKKPDTTRRDQEIRDRYNPPGPPSIRDLAGEYGISATRVHQIIKPE